MKQKFISKKLILTLIVGVFLGIIWHNFNIFPFPQLTNIKTKIQKKSKPNIPGSWRTSKTLTPPKKLSKKQLDMIKQLNSIGYLSGSHSAPLETAVTTYDENAAFNGYNLITSGHKSEAILIDMEGKTIHKWSYNISQVWPDFNPNENQHSHTYWRRVHLFKNGDILAIFEGVGLIKLDKNSNLIWSNQNNAHHDLYIKQNGNILVLTRKAHINKKYNEKKPILEDYICELDAQGNEIRSISIMDAINKSPFAPILARAKNWGDILHTNTIELIKEDSSVPLPSFKKGRVLISICYINLICVLDFNDGLVWAESDLWHGQHESSILDNGNLLLLDNLGLKNVSRIIEFNPVTRKIVWEYGNSKNEPFFTASCGSCQRLPNGNTLITESDPGRAFEVKPDKKIVWSYVNPYRAGKNNELIATLFEVERFKPDFFSNWLK